MNEIDATTWEDFLDRVKQLRESGMVSPTLLYRGQSNSDWPLTTTLERAGRDGMRFAEYNGLIARVRPAVESFTSKKWDAPEWDPRHDVDFLKYETFPANNFPSLNQYAYMTYLRHHGFPSPLLDWTYSPFVAGFFAFREAQEGVPNRAIYVFCEMPKGFKLRGSSEPHIRSMGQYIRTDPRHFRQQSDYTLCGIFEGHWSYYSHQNVFDHGNSEQDALWKFNIPSSERTRVLRILNSYNLNAFSLFDSEESLMETMWFREAIGNGNEPQPLPYCQGKRSGL